MSSRQNVEKLVLELIGLKDKVEVIEKEISQKKKEISDALSFVQQQNIMLEKLSAEKKQLKEEGRRKAEEIETLDIETQDDEDSSDSEHNNPQNIIEKDVKILEISKIKAESHRNDLKPNVSDSNESSKTAKRPLIIPNLMTVAEPVESNPVMQNNPPVTWFINEEPVNKMSKLIQTAKNNSLLKIIEICEGRINQICFQYDRLLIYGEAGLLMFSKENITKRFFGHPMKNIIYARVVRFDDRMLLVSCTDGSIGVHNAETAELIYREQIRDRILSANLSGSQLQLVQSNGVFTFNIHSFKKYLLWARDFRGPSAITEMYQGFSAVANGLNVYILSNTGALLREFMEPYVVIGILSVQPWLIIYSRHMISVVSCFSVMDRKSFPFPDGIIEISCEQQTMIVLLSIGVLLEYTIEQDGSITFSREIFARTSTISVSQAGSVLFINTGRAVFKYLYKVPQCLPSSSL